MTIATIFDEITAEGVELSLTTSGTISAKGDKEAVGKFAPTIKQYRAEIIDILTRRGEVAPSTPETQPVANTERRFAPSEVEDHDPTPATRPKKKQTSCRAFKVTGIHAVTSAKHCLDRQGPHCGKCQLRQTDLNTKEIL